eukprot:SAG31_NODE_273_length_18667_cov_3.603619_5_plen_58_part_00
MYFFFLIKICTAHAPIGASDRWACGMAIAWRMALPGRGALQLQRGGAGRAERTAAAH